MVEVMVVVLEMVVMVVMVVKTIYCENLSQKYQILYNFMILLHMYRALLFIAHWVLLTVT